MALLIEGLGRQRGLNAAGIVLNNVALDGTIPLIHAAPAARPGRQSPHGYATTMFNRRRYLDELNDPSYQVREFAKRAAMNAPIQGSAADLIKIAMVKVDEALVKNNFKSCLISQIHDELILKVYDDEKDAVKALVSDIMENCVKLKVSLKVDGGYAKTWFDAK